MSFITWQENRLIQRVGIHEEELGYLALDQNSKTYVLWLKDTCGVLGLNGGYIRGDEFPSMTVAKQKVESSPSVLILHCIWMRNGVKRETIRALNDHWDEISPNLPHDASKEGLRDRIGRYIEKLSREEIEVWAGKIRDNLIVSAIIELAKRLLGG